MIFLVFYKLTLVYLFCTNYFAKTMKKIEQNYYNSAVTKKQHMHNYKMVGFTTV